MFIMIPLIIVSLINTLVYDKTINPDILLIAVPVAGISYFLYKFTKNENG